MMCRRSMQVALVAALAAAGLVAVPAARQAPAQGPTFRAGVDSVIVDAVVTDKQGHPVTNLTADDFEVRESGKPQTIQTFKLIQIDDGRTDSMAQRDIASTEDEERETSREDNRLFAIFLDDYHVRLQSSLAVRQRLAAFVAGLTPHDLVTVTTPLIGTGGLTFTRDHDAVADTIAHFQGRKYDYTPRNAIEERYAGAPPEVQEQFRNDAAISALSNLCEFMGSLRDGRKTILYVSEGLTATLPAGIRTTGGLPGAGITQGSGLPANVASVRSFSDNAALLSEMRTVFSDASRSNTSIYTLDPRGLVGSAFGASEDVSVADSTQTLTEETDMLRVIADNTDGRAIVGRNDFETDLRQMVADNSTYYLLGYTSTLAPRDGKFHEIQVRVKRKDLEVRARKGYWAYSADEITRTTAPKPAISAAVTDALDELAGTVEPARHRAIEHWIGARRGPAEKALVTFAWETPEGAPADPIDAVDSVTLTATSINGDDLYRGVVPVDPQAGRTGGQVTFEAPAGSISVRVVTQAKNGVRLDTEDATFDVPDFTSTGPQLTLPWVYRGRTALDFRQVRTAAAPPFPAISRSFAHTDLLLLRFGAYGPAGTAPAVTAALLNQEGASIAALPAPTRVDAATFELQLGLVTFPPGNYVIELSAESNGQTARRLLAIRVAG